MGTPSTQASQELSGELLVALFVDRFRLEGDPASATEAASKSGDIINFCNRAFGRFVSVTAIHENDNPIAVNVKSALVKGGVAHDHYMDRIIGRIQQAVPQADYLTLAPWPTRFWTTNIIDYTVEVIDRKSGEPRVDIEFIKQ